MSEQFNPLRHSVVQAVSGSWEQYECDDFVEALFASILDEIKRVHWNVYQHSWGATWHGDEVEDPEIPGIHFVRYYDGCECEDEPAHRPECRHAKPNFQFEDVAFRWYKYPGRGMSTNKAWISDEWRAWFYRCKCAIRAFDTRLLDEQDQARTDALRANLAERYPQSVARPCDHTFTDKTVSYRECSKCKTHESTVRFFAAMTAAFDEIFETNDQS